MPRQQIKYRLRNKVQDPESSSSESEYEEESTDYDEDDETYSEESTEKSSSSEELKSRNKNKKIDRKQNARKQNNKKQNTKKITHKSESSSSDDDEEDDVDPKDFRKLLSSMFPSKYMSKKVKDDAEPKSLKKSKSQPKLHKKSKKTKGKKEESSEDESIDLEEESDEEEDDSEEEEDSDYDSDEESEEEEKRINIILSMNPDDEYANYFGGEEDEEEDDEDEECDTDDEETFMKENFEKIQQPILTESDSKMQEKKDKKKKEKKRKEDDSEETDQSHDVELEYIELIDLKKDLHKKLLKNPKSKILSKRIEECSEDIKQLVKSARTKNAKKYKKLLTSDNKTPNEMTYFKKKMSNAEQLRIMRELKEVNEHLGVDKPYRISLLESQIPAKLKSQALQKLNLLNMMDSSDSEYYKIKNWIDNFMRIPFCKYSSLNVSMDDGIEKCHEFMANARSILDKCVYGLDDAKMQILQMVGQWIANPNSLGSAIAIKGPPGTGKTTLVKDGISKILGREFVFIPLGGTGDASFLEGHSYTYEGSMWGKIVQSLMDCKTMNPVFFFDELDKLSETPKGDEIIGILTHLTDTTQNSQFHDKYFSEVDFDLSKCLFIFSYNDESKVNPILKDRMYRIQTKGYDVKEKTVIAHEYMLPKIREQINFKAEDIIIPDETIRYIVSTPHLTQDEDGVRNMRRCLEIIHTKLNLFRLVRPEDNIFAKDIALPVKFPIKITNKEIDILIKNDEKQRQSLLSSMYI